VKCIKICHFCRRYVSIFFVIFQAFKKLQTSRLLVLRKRLIGRVIRTFREVNCCNKSIDLMKRISPGPRRFETFRNNKNFYGEGLLAPRPTRKMEDHPLSAVRDCLFNIFVATLIIWRTFLHPQPEDAPCRGDKGHI
jgi:hypothetical protein